MHVLPRWYGSIGRPKGQSNSKNHKASGKREGTGQKKLTFQDRVTSYHHTLAQLIWMHKRE